MKDSIVDMKRIHDIFGDDVTAINEFFKSFIDLTADLLQEIQAAINNQDTQLAKQLFHRLKGSAGNSGVMQIYTLSLQAEEKVLAGEWDEAEKLFSSIEWAFKELQIELKL